MIVLDDLSGGFIDHVPEGTRFIQGSVTDHELIMKLFTEEKFDYVYHLAAYAAEGLSHFIRRFNYTNNLIGSINLINEAVKNNVKCFVFTSSIAVYGSGQLPMTEVMVPSPEDPYGISKFAVELDLHAAHSMFGLNFIIFRPHNVYGENQNIGDRYRNVIGIFMNQIMQGKPMTIFGDGTQTRAFSYIDDVAPYISRSVTTSDAINQTINIGADRPYSVKTLAEIIAAQFAITPNIEYLPPRNEVLNAYADHSKAYRIFNIQNTVPLNEGVKQMADWARKVGVRKGQVFHNIEVSKNMPASWKSVIE